MRPSASSKTYGPAVLRRFALRTAMLAMFAGFGTLSYGRGLAALLWLAIIICAVVAAIRREPLFGADLNHWDEMTAFAALLCMVLKLDQMFVSG
ncbi:hypothetical protein [Bradyrhizobium sp. STM 3557]|uniref:hypothetical protein n=1 Tax=Bradyrhizobium sp. STM 3557 TaxID=578920 RepID=UPI00388E75B5